jgi:hypothetical protein
MDARVDPYFFIHKNYTNVFKNYIQKGKPLPSLRCTDKRWGLQGVYFDLIERFKH